MVRPPDLGLLPVDHLDVLEAVLAQASPGHCRTGQVPLARFGIRQIHEAVVGKGRVERDIEQAALATGLDLWHAREGRGDAAIWVDAAEPPRSFGHEQTPVREKGQGPGMLETLRQGLDMDGARHGRWRRRTRRLGGRQPGCDDEQAGGEDACDVMPAGAGASTGKKPPQGNACHRLLSFLE